MKSIVIYYSLEGNTELIAKTISKKINGDILELIPKKEYYKTGFKKFFWGGKSVVFKEKPQLMDYNIDFSKYDNIFIGTPIWVGTFTPPINTFLNEITLSDKNIYMFACHSGGGANKFYDSTKNVIPTNTFIDQIDFCNPLTKNTKEELDRLEEWLKNNNFII